MELKEFFDFFKKNYKLILSIGFFVGIISLCFSLFSPTKYQASVNFFLTKINKPITSDFQYDDYYAIKACELQVEALEFWLKTPEIVDEIYKKAKIDLEEKSLKKLSKEFKPKKLSAQNLEVKFEKKNKEEAEKISQILIEKTEEKTLALQKTQKEEPSFKIENVSKIIVKTKPNHLLIFLIGFFVGIVCGTGISFFRESIVIHNQ